MPTALQDEIASKLRDHIVDGDSGSGPYTPVIGDLRDILDGMAVGEQWITEVETFLNAANVGAARTGVGLGTGDSPTFTALTLSGGLTVDTSTLKVDATNNRVGVGTATPAVAFDVVGAAAFASTVDITGDLTTTGDADLGGSTMFIDASSGRVGIGTLSPQTGLQVEFGGLWVKENSVNPAFKVTQLGSGIVALFEDSDSTDNSPFTILTDGRIVQGYTAAIAGASGVTPQFQVHSTGGETGYSATRWSSDANGATLYLNKSRGSAVNTHGGLSINDTIATISLGGDDGTNFIPSVQILGQVDATPGTNDMGGRFVVKTTPDGSATPSERLRIDSTGFMSFGGDTDTGITSPGANELSFWSGGAEAMRLEENGRLIIGHTDSIATNKGGSATSFDVQVHGATAATAGVSITNWGAVSGTDPSIVFGKSMSGAIGSRSAVGSGDNLGAVGFAGDDGTNFASAAYILAECDGTVSSGVVPGRVSISTATSGGTLTEAFRLDSAQKPYFPGHATTGTAANAVLLTGSSPAGELARNSSSIRYKTDVEDVTEYDLGGLFDLRPVTYRSLCAVDDPNRQHFGFIAEEVNEVDPRLVYTSEIDGVTVPEGVEYDRLTVLLVGAVKDLAARVEALEAAE